MKRQSPKLISHPLMKVSLALTFYFLHILSEYSMWSFLLLVSVGIISKIAHCNLGDPSYKNNLSYRDKTTCIGGSLVTGPPSLSHIFN